MKYLLLFFSTIFCVLFHCLASSHEKKCDSVLYNSKGQLIADSTLNITKQQLLKFAEVEEELIVGILDSLKVSSTLWENGMPVNVIISFTIDDQSCFSNLVYAKQDVLQYYAKQDELHKILNSDFQLMFGNAIINWSCKLKDKGFKARKNQYETFYLPIRFNIKDDSRGIEGGWLYYQISPLPAER